MAIKREKIYLRKHKHINLPVWLTINSDSTTPGISLKLRERERVLCQPYSSAKESTELNLIQQFYRACMGWFACSEMARTLLNHRHRYAILWAENLSQILELWWTGSMLLDIILKWTENYFIVPSKNSITQVQLLISPLHTLAARQILQLTDDIIQFKWGHVYENVWQWQRHFNY